MADPFDVMGGNSNTGNPDFWRNLTTFGLSAMAAGGEPGATTLGALGQGGLGAMTASRENALARGQANLYGAEAQSKMLSNMVALQQINMQRQMIGMPPIGGQQPTTMQDQTPAAPPSLSTGMPFSPTAGMVSKPAEQTIQSSSQPPSGVPTTIRPEALMGQVLPTQAEAVQMAKYYQVAGMQDMAKKYLDFAYTPAIEGRSAMEKAPAELFVETNKPRELGPNSALYQGGNIVARGATEGVSPDGTPFRMPARPENNMQANTVMASAQAAGVPPQLAMGVFGQESNFGQNTGPSSAGATGPMQLMPSTAKDPGFGVNPPKDGSPQENIRAGTEYLGAMMQKYQGNQPLALMAYNWGPGNVDNWLQSGADPSKVPAETRNYISGVMLKGIGSGLQNVAPGDGQKSSNIPEGAVQSGLSPAESSYQTGRGKSLADRTQTVDEDAAAAKQALFILSQMKGQAENFRMGKWGSMEGEAAKYLRVLNPAYDEKVANYEAFIKNSIRLTNEEVRQVSSRAAVQEYQAIQSAQPQPEMSPGGFKIIVNQAEGIQDYKIAKQVALDSWLQTHKTPEGFEGEFNKNVSPTVFLINRMSSDDFKEMAANLQKKPNGPVVLKNILEKMKYAKQNGLLE